MRATGPSAALEPSVVAAYGKLPLSFEKNDGQSDRKVKYLSRGQGYGLFLTANEAVLALRGTLCDGADKPPRSTAPSSAHRSPCVSRETAVRLQMSGANPNPKIMGIDPLPGKSNYFIGNDPTQWHTNVSNYSKVKYENVYPGIDLVYYGNQRQLEFDLVVAPGADPRQVRFKLEGAKKLELNSAGDLIIHSRNGDISLHKPEVYQDAGEGKRPVKGHYALNGRNEVAFEVGPYDKSKALVVDPTLVYATYLGGTGTDYGVAIAVDASGNAYIGGNTTSTDFPIANPFQTSGSMFVTKLNDTGSALIYSSYFGGPTSGFNSLNGLAIDTAGNAYVTGTAGTGFPRVNQISSACDLSCQSGSGAFVAKIDAAGATLLYSSRVGIGSRGEAIAVDSSGDAYVAGQAANPDFPTVNAFQPTLGGSNAFLLKVDAAGSALLYSTFLGGSATDEATGVAVDSSGSAYVAGTTNSPNFPTLNQIPGACVGTCGTGANEDVFVSKFSSDGSALIYSSLLGGSGEDLAAPATSLVEGSDFGNSIVIDSSGNAYVAGATSPAGIFVRTTSTTQNNFPTTPGAFQRTPNCASSCIDGFVTKINAAGNALSFSTFFGTTPSYVNGLAVDSSGDVAALGLFVIPFVNQVYRNGGSDASVGVLNPAGSALLFSTTQGVASGGTFDSQGNLYLAGFTCGNGIAATSGAFQTTCNSSGTGSNAFVSKISLSGSSPSVVSFTPGSLTFASQNVGTSSAAQKVTLTNSGAVSLDITGISITGTDAGDYSETNTCGATLAASANCTISVTFKPTASGTRAASISVADNASGSPQSVSLTGTGAAPAAPANFSFAASPASLTVTAGSSGTSTLTVTPANGFNQAVTFACSGLPSQATCSFAPASITPNGAAASTTLTITTTGTTTTGMNREPALPASGTRLTLALAGIFAGLFSLGSIGRNRLRLLPVLVAIIGLGVLTGCGGSSSSKTAAGTQAGTPTGTYNVTVTATSGSGSSALSQASAVTLIVQ